MTKRPLRRTALRCEMLEERNLLTAFFVTQANDTGNPAVVGSMSWAIEGVNLLNTDPIAFDQNPAYETVFAVVNSPDIIDLTLVPFNPGAGDDRVSLFSNLPSLDFRTTIQGGGATIDASGISGAHTGIRLNYGAGATQPGAGVEDLKLVGFELTPLRVFTVGNAQVLFDNVDVIDNDALAIRFEASPTAGGSITVSNSTISGNEGGIRVDGISSGQISISDNTISDSNGIPVDFTTSGARDVAITGNTITAGGSHNAIDFPPNSFDVVIDGNTINSASGHGVFLSSSASDVIISDNTVSAVAGAAVEVQVLASNIDIIDNPMLSSSSNWAVRFANTGSSLEISGNSIQSNSNYGLVFSSVANLDIVGNSVTSSGVAFEAIAIGNATDVVVSGNNLTANNAPGLLLGTVSDSSITQNVIQSTGGSPITTFSSTGLRNRVSNNTLTFVPDVAGESVVIPPFDLRGDGEIEGIDPGDTDTGPNSRLNAPRILEDDVYTSTGQITIPVETEFDAAGDYRFELFRVSTTTGGGGDITSATWTPVDNVRIVAQIPEAAPAW